MTDLKKSDTLGHSWQRDDIRATNLSVRWQHYLLGMQSLVLVGLDMTMLYASWTISDTLGTPVAGEHVAHSMIPILAVSIGTLATAGFYGTDDKLNRFAKLFKSLTVAQIVVLIAAFFYQPGLWVSRSVFLMSWVLNFVLIGSARFCFDVLTIQLRKHNPIFQNQVVLLGHQQDIHNVKKLIQRSRLDR
jgi:FlaA1/EpsC-like NDP-sugar epimerase